MCRFCRQTTERSRPHCFWSSFTKILAIKESRLCKGSLSSADEQTLLGSQPLSVDVVLLQLLVTGLPEPGEDSLDVQSVNGVRGHHPAVHLQHKHQGYDLKSFNDSKVCVRTILNTTKMLLIKALQEF